MANINIRIDDNLKKDAENLFNDLGLNMTTATTMFLKQCLYCHGLPFDPGLVLYCPSRYGWIPSTPPPTRPTCAGPSPIWTLAMARPTS